jgi:crotonobetainyl-CoA:carnitine CoA-transferase CaiB-like acyl-CoA transferase
MQRIRTDDDDTPTSAQPLRGLKIVDLTTVVFGPYASQLLGEYGAEVIKVEAPGGDSTRRIGPSREAGMASLFIGVNKNKRSIGIDLRKEAGREALLRILRHADVFMHNMRPAKIERLGLGPKTLRAFSPNLIYAGLHGFGDSGPYAGSPAYDDIIQGLSGLVGLMECHLGEPRYFPMAIADKVAALFAVQAILAAVIQRSSTGTGTTIEIPMFESVVSFGLVEHLYGAQFSPPLDRIGYPRALMPWRRPYLTSDGAYVCIMPYSDANWRALLTAVGDLETLSDQRFSDLQSRTRNIDALYQRLGQHILSRSAQTWLNLCTELDVPAHRMNRLEDLENDPHLKAVQHFRTVRDERMGDLVIPANPITFDGHRLEHQVPPRLGADTLDLLGEAGLSADEIAKLELDGVIEADLS